jgi:hypothetical protein
MNRSSLRRSVLILSGVLVTLSVTHAANANPPAREEITGPDDQVVTDQCAFPVLVLIEGVGFVTTFTDGEGNPVMQHFHFPNNKTVLTNLDTRKSVTVSTTGPARFRVDPDGSSSFQVTGRSPWVGHPITEAPGIFLIAGRLLATFDAEGNHTSIDFTGKVVDLVPDSRVSQRDLDHRSRAPRSRTVASIMRHRDLGDILALRCLHTRAERHRAWRVPRAFVYANRSQVTGVGYAKQSRCPHRRVRHGTVASISRSKRKVKAPPILF